LTNDKDAQGSGESHELIELQLYRARIDRARSKGFAYFLTPILITPITIFIVMNANKYDPENKYTLGVIFLWATIFAAFLFLGIKKIRSSLNEDSTINAQRMTP
jgi:uncharacterized membrane protein